ncbi:hypothetical protein E2C01_069576 [Portunus trituberculatus]|uniref:Uncharacterized protein n=1 Tax=Portunus trituberculatus TaxID=210409 RepID=A0A5B7HUX1_PORTR|nr:hypothetical protein [Portunus trituberculatus]
MAMSESRRRKDEGIWRGKEGKDEGRIAVTAATQKPVPPPPPPDGGSCEHLAGVFTLLTPVVTRDPVARCPALLCLPVHAGVAGGRDMWWEAGRGGCVNKSWAQQPVWGSLFFPPATALPSHVGEQQSLQVCKIN